MYVLWIAGGLLSITGGVFLAVRRARSSFVIVTVEGTSMTPTLSPGDQVVVKRRRISEIRRRDIVVIQPPKIHDGRYESLDEKQWNIKRVAALPGDPVPDGIPGAQELTQVPQESMVVFGDNHDSIDSRHRGFFPTEHVLGVVIRRLGGREL